MKNLTWMLLLMVLAVASPRAARADLGYWSAALVGTWRHPTNGDVYRFNSDATYTFTPGGAARQHGHLWHSGWWKIGQPTAKERAAMHGPVALIIKARRRTVIDGSSTQVVPTKRDFRLLVNTVLVEGKGDSRDLYRIDGVNWRRVKP